MKKFEHHLNEMTKGLEDHQFRHYNRSLGMMIYSKEHYIQVLKERRMVPDSMAQDLREDYESKNQKKGYELSPKAKGILTHLESLRGRSKGMIKLSEYPKLVKAMKEVGLDYERSYEEYLTQ